MLREVCKSIVIALSVTSMLVACGPGEEEKAAAKLLDEARTAIDNKQFENAIGLLDTLSVLHPKMTKVIKKAIELRPVAIEGVTIKQLEQSDSLMALARWRADSLSPMFTTVNDSRLVEPYTVAKAAPANIYSRTGIEARVTPDGAFSIVSSLNGPKIRHTSITLSDGNEAATSESVPTGSEANYTINGSETVTFSVHKCDTIGDFAVKHDNRPLKLTFNGTKTHTIKLSPKEVHAIADTYRLATARQEGIMLTKKKEILRAKLQLARDQQARTKSIEDKVK